MTKGLEHFPIRRDGTVQALGLFSQKENNQEKRKLGGF